MIWNNYKLAGHVPADRIESMWRTLERIAAACQSKHPADAEFMTKDAIREAAEAALPAATDKPRETTQDVFDVIASHPDGRAYGITFSTEQAAQEYARRMTAAGYKDCTVMPITARETSAAGLAEAAEFFADSSLAGQQEGRE